MQVTVTITRGSQSVQAVVHMHASHVDASMEGVLASLLHHSYAGCDDCLEYFPESDLVPAEEWDKDAREVYAGDYKLWKAEQHHVCAECKKLN